MRPLYAMALEYQVLMESIESDDERLPVILNELEGDIERKAAGIGAVLNSLHAEESALDAEIERLTARRKRAQTAHDKLKQYIKDNMERMGATKLKGGTFTFAIQNNPESVVVTDEALVPDEMKNTKVTVSVDKRAVLDAYKKHGEISPGCDIVRTSRLVVK